MTCVQDCRHFITIDYSKRLKSPKDDHMPVTSQYLHGL